MQASIIISSFNRLPLFRRALWSIATRGPKISFEVIVVDDGSTDDILGELKTFSSCFAWKLVRFDAKTFEEQTGLTKFLNNPCVTNNIGFAVADKTSEVIFQQGNEIIAWEDCYDQMIRDIPSETPNWIVASTTYDIPQNALDFLDRYGQNFLPAYLDLCKPFPLQSEFYRSDVTNYICAISRAAWEGIGGYDERYYGGISAEDSDFVRRARTLPDFQQVISKGVSLHQFHSGRTKYYEPPTKVISKERWAEGAAINRCVFDSWNGQTFNPQLWKPGKIGVGEIITNTK